MAGHGCELKLESVKSIQEVRVTLGDTPLYSMDISNNSLRADGTVAFAHIMLTSNFFRFDRPLPNPVASNLVAAVTELDISRNSLGIAGSTPIESLLSAPQCTLKKLLLCSNLLADLGCANVCRALQKNTTLTCLNLSENGASNAAGVQLGIALEKNSVLEDLNLAYNHLRETGARRIGHGLCHNKTVKKLDLQWNGFGDEETILEFAKAIPVCGVTELNLAYNRIKLKAATIVASFIEGGSNIKELVLDGNLIGQIGARMLLRAVQEASRRGQEFSTTVSAMPMSAMPIE
jgi:hypothetical protein